LRRKGIALRGSIQEMKLKKEEENVKELLRENSMKGIYSKEFLS